MVAHYLSCTRALSHTGSALYRLLRYRNVTVSEDWFDACMTAVAGQPVHSLHGRFCRRTLDFIGAHLRFAACADRLRFLTLDLGAGDFNAAWSVATVLPQLEALDIGISAHALSGADVALVQPFESPRLGALRLRLGCRVIARGVAARIADATAASDALRVVEWELADGCGFDADDLRTIGVHLMARAARGLQQLGIRASADAVDLLCRSTTPHSYANPTDTGADTTKKKHRAM